MFTSPSPPRPFGNFAPWKYRSAIFVHNEDQRSAALAILESKGPSYKKMVAVEEVMPIITALPPLIYGRRSMPLASPFGPMHALFGVSHSSLTPLETQASDFYAAETYHQDYLDKAMGVMKPRKEAYVY